MSKDTIMVKPPKKFPHLLWMIVFTLAVSCTVYIFLIYAKQINDGTSSKFRDTEIINRNGHEDGVDKSQTAHYLKLKNLSRTELLGTEIIKRDKRSNGIDKSQIPPMQYPEARTFSRDYENGKAQTPPVHYPKPINIRSAEFVDDKSIKRHCHGTDKSQTPYVHYPMPRTFSRGECACIPVRLFVILSMQRSGSLWFVSLLNSHTNVSSLGEVFVVEGRRNNASSILKTMNAVYNLDLFIGPPKNECVASVGFKWMLNQGLMEHHKEIVQYLNSRGVSVIFLFRRNLLRRIVSLRANKYATLKNGKHVAHVKSQKLADTLSRYKPVINVKTLMAKLKLAEKAVLQVVKYFSSTRHIVLYYEDLMKNMTKLVDVQEFLKIPVMELTSPAVKIHKGPLSEHISNWDKVQKTLQGTMYNRFLYDEY